MKKVYVLNDGGVARMFQVNGWTLVDNDLDADLVVFTGGEDVDPSYYGEEKHGATYSNPRRDARESHIFHQNLDKPKVGICRGGQFLNVMSGGRMWQHVNNHGVRHTHEAITSDGEVVQVTSTHHQMMRPSDEGEILLAAKLSTYKETATERHIPRKDEMDVESVFYPKTKSLCFQPHPEYVNIDHECQTLFFRLLQEKLGV